MDKKQAKTIADAIVNEDVLPFLKSLQPKMVSDEVFLAFCQTTILTLANTMYKFCDDFEEFENKPLWIDSVKKSLHQGIDKFFPASLLISQNYTSDSLQKTH
ncbi:hypothetical protein AVI51_16515 (plasmid) [Piscirickettsia salmonis]|uniref:Uncharacterized protein n=1 Tax=Piscirickettsia salmonis TaxID=1238 RepID=A0A9Q5YLC2_PISSA|nr:hypothetical protein [Piscirickettsia salmonis]RNC76559.1 hypothetical protein DA717_15305 [Piscirickettsiaceae bacterium NZ-RLO2]ALA26736.1 group 1 family glycosyl transferase [Piscirickettsia salmonis]APS49386.1 hypothetical protein AVI49_17170 [Piscirickettsia salmonis]APS52539.1 hypothetical protein AVI50_16950 [Piscirickettsia salmonis]APS55706.1 hypothetical protein AVI51_16515 [Piscirickettsia salmonis]